MKSLAIAFFLLLGGVSYCQQRACLLYKETQGEGFVCVSDDTIAFVLPNGEYFYGTYNAQDSVIITQDNLLSKSNHTIVTIESDPSVMEIEILFLEKQFGYGYVNNPDTTPHLKRAERIIVLYDYDKESKVSDATGIISFNHEELNSLKDTLSCFAFVDGWSFRTEANIPVVYGNKYVIKQKKYGMNPFIIKEGRPYSYAPLVYFCCNEKENIVFKYNKSGEILKFHYTGQCHSCIEELRKWYPDLFYDLNY